MKKFFLVLLFCVFPFHVLAGDVSYWADGQIKSIDGQDVSALIGMQFPLVYHGIAVRSESELGILNQTKPDGGTDNGNG